MKEIYDIAYTWMEGCDEPEFSALEEICYIASHPEEFYEKQMENLDEYYKENSDACI